MKLKHIIGTVLILILGSLITYRISQNKSLQEPGKKKGGEKSPTFVNAQVVTTQEFSNTLSLSGSIEANEQVEIRSEVSGRVVYISFSEGSQVMKGQILFKVNDVELQAQLAQALNKQNLASENERRAKLLLEKEAISQEEYDIVSADFRTALSQTQLIRAQLEKTTIRAPFSGKIGLRSISPGTYVTPSTMVAKLVNTNPLKITFTIPEKYASHIKINTMLTFTVNGMSEKFAAKIYAIEPEIETTTRTLNVRAIADNKSGKLLPGTFANVEFPLETLKEAIVIPSEAILPVQNGKKVFIANQGKAKEVMVETLTRTEKDIIITSGLKVGDTVLTTGVMSLREGAPIKIKISK